MLKKGRLCFSGPAAFAIGLLLAAGCSAISQSQAATVKPNNVIRVWSVGSPFSGLIPQTIVPPDLQRQAEKLGYTIVVQNFRSAGFSSILHEAFATHTEPEFITFTNFGILIGGDGPGGRYQGVLDTDYAIAESLHLVSEKFLSMQPRGWVVLLGSAANAEPARALVMQPPQCQARVGGPDESLSDGLQQALETANNAAWAYLGCDSPALMSQSDDARLGRKCFMPNVSVHVEAVKSCGVLGNDTLAFVPLAGTFVSQPAAPMPRREDAYSHWLGENALGQQTVLAILRKQDGVWRLLAITTDPIDTNPTVHATYTTLQRLSRLLTSEPSAAAVPSPAVLTTADGARLRRLSQSVFDNFEWTPSASPDVAAQVVEFLIGDREGPRELTRLFFLLGHEDRLSSGFLVGLGGRWRVWSISRTGNVSMTEPRSYTQWFARP